MPLLPPAVTHHGAPAVAALRRAIDNVRGDGALAPVTVVVPNNASGLAARRALGRHGGLLNVRFMVAGRLAELIAAGHTGKRGPLGPALRSEAVRAALIESPGIFAAVAEHPSTVQSLERTFEDLRPVDDAGLDALAGRSARGASVVDTYRRFRTRTADYYDTADLFHAAASVVAAQGVPSDIGGVVYFLPRELLPWEQELFEALGQHARVALVAGAHGDEQADAFTGDVLGHSPRIDEPSLEGTRVVAAADADEEVRTTVRQIAAELENTEADAVPLHRIAVLYTAEEPYAMSCAERFSAAGIPFNGPGSRRLADSLAGRLLLLLLAIAEGDYRREDVIEFLALPLKPSGRGEYPASRWEVLARSALPGPGLESWRRRLGYLAATRLGDAVVQFEDGAEGRARRMEADAHYATDLVETVESLDERLQNLAACGSWDAFRAWCTGALAEYLAAGALSEDEQVAFDAIQAALEDLGALDELGTVPATDVFARALRSQLQQPWGRHGAFEEGLYVGPVRSARGMNFDLVFVLGMVEGLAPRTVREDPLLPDRERQQVPGLSLTVSTRAARERETFLAGIHTAPRRVFSMPMADMRAGRENLPARWLLAFCARLQQGGSVAAPIAASTFKQWTRDARERPAWLHVVPSQAAALLSNSTHMAPADLSEYDLRALGEGGAGPVSHPIATASTVARGIGASRARMSHAFTEWDGDVGPDEALRLSSGSLTSPTAFEHWAACGFRYFLQRGLRVTPTEEEDEGLRLDAKDRGTLVHRALEQLVRPYIEEGAVPAEWTADHRARLREIGEELCGELEKAGVVGQPLLWRINRRNILNDLEHFLDQDNERRRAGGLSPVAVELRFDQAGDPVEIPLPNGTARFRGKIDRVDRAADGSLAIIDYKTGGAKNFEGFNDDMLDSGRRLQLPLYGLAASRHFDAPVSRLEYLFVNRSANPARVEAQFDDADRQQLVEHLERVDDVLAEGIFPAWPGDSDRGTFKHCKYCDFQRLCVRDRGRAWNRKLDDERLQRYAIAVGEVVDIVDQDEDPWNA